MCVFPQVVINITCNSYVTIHLARLARLPLEIIFLYLCIAGINRDLISLEITPQSLWVCWMENYLLLMLPLPSKHSALSCTYQFLLLFPNCIFYSRSIYSSKNSGGFTRFIKSFQIAKLEKQMMLAFSIITHSLFRKQICSMCNI